METGPPTNSFITSLPQTKDSPHQQHNQQDLNNSKKSQPPRTYTFYHSTRSQASSRLSFNQPYKNEYRYSSEQTDQPRRKTLSQSSSGAVNYSGEQTKTKLSPVGFRHTENAFKKSMHVPEVSCFKPDLYASESQAEGSNRFQQFLDKGERIQQQRRNISSEMIESKIITQPSEIEQQNRRFSLNDLDLESKTSQSVSRKYSNLQEEFTILREKFDIIEAENKVLEKRNLDLVQEMLTSESVIRDFQEKQKKHQETTKKNEDSIKISRNIITSLNDKIARLQKESEVNLKIAEEAYQGKLSALEESKNEALKASQALIFELKLKLIDQNHQMEDTVSKEKRLLQEQTSLQLKQQLSEKEKIIACLEEQTEKQRQCLLNLDADLMKLDQENVRLDQQNNRLVTINASLLQNQPLIHSLTAQVQSLKKQLSELTEVNRSQETSLERLKADTNQKQGQENRLKGEIQACFMKLETAEAVIEVLRKQKELRQSEIERLSVQLQHFEQNNRNRSQHESESIQNLQQELGTTKQIQQELECKLDSFIRDNQILSSEVAILKQEAIDTKTFLDSIEKKYQQKKAEVEQLEETIEDKDTQISQININQLNLQLEILDLKERIRKTQAGSPLPVGKQLRSEEEDQNDQEQTGEKGVQEEAEVVEKIDQNQIVEKKEDGDLHKNYLEQIQQLRSRIVELEERENKNAQKISEMESKLSETTNKQQPFQEISELKGQLQTKDEEIKGLKMSLLSRENEIIDLSLKVDSLLEEKTPEESLLAQSTLQQLTQELHHNSELKEKLRIQEIQNELLHSELKIVKGQNEELEKQLKFMEEAQLQLRTEESRLIAELQEEVAASKQKQEQIRKELEDLKEMLKRQQEEYLITLDQQIKKITMIEEEERLEKEQLLKKQLIEGEDDSLGAGISAQYGNSEMFEQWMQGIEGYSKEDLISKVQELIFVNQSLNMKVNELNEMEDNSNDIIMNKIRLFQEVIEKYQLEINELQEQNQDERNKGRELAQKCLFLQGKIEWMDNIYKELEENLQETNEQLLKAQVQYINIKMSLEKVEEKEDQQVGVQSEIEANQKIGSDRQAKSVDISISEDEGPEEIEKKEIVIRELKQMNLALQQEIYKAEHAHHQVEASEHVNRMKEQEQIYHEDELEQHQLRRFMEGEYYIKESQLGGTTYSIVVSQVDSEQQGQLEQSPEKMAADEIDIDNIILNYTEDNDEKQQIPPNQISSERANKPDDEGRDPLCEEAEVQQVVILEVDSEEGKEKHAALQIQEHDIEEPLTKQEKNE